MLKTAAAAWPVLPAAAMLRPAAAHAPHLQAYDGQVLGLGAAACLLACLAITPLSRLRKMRQPGRHRQWYGLCAFALGAEGLVIAFAGYPGDGQAGAGRVTGTVQLWTGTLIVAAMLPAAATANRAAQRLLGAHWKTWQRRLAYAAWAAILLHVAVLGAWRAGAALALASAPLAAARAPAMRGVLARHRAAAVTAFALGSAMLAWLEVTACARAVRLAPA